MNDNELITIVRESVAGVHSATPVAQVISRGRVVRARRRIPAVAGTAAALAGIALAVTTLLPSGHPGSHDVAQARLAAWTVVKQANGDIDVTINQLQNPRGLQNTLRADGLPVNVTFSRHSPTTSCQLYPTSGHVLSAVVHFSINGAPFLINTSALPTGVGLAIFVGGAPDDLSMPPSAPAGTVNGFGRFDFRVSDGHLRMVYGLLVSPVYASKQCTG